MQVRAGTAVHIRLFVRRAIVCALLCAGGLVNAQESGPRVSIIPRRAAQASLDSSSAHAIRLDVQLVLVPVMVTDLRERPVHTLRQADFRLFEDGAEQEITHFARQESPVSIAVVFDSSGSMERKMDASRRAVAEFLRMSLPGDEFSLIKFSDTPEPVQAFTRTPDAIQEAVDAIEPGGWTALFDAIYLAMNDMKRAAYPRKAMLVISDGGDNKSRYNEREIKSIVQERDVRIFAISIQSRSQALERLAEESGGRSYRVRKLEELPDLAAAISEDLHSEYVLGYAPSNRPRDGKYRKLKVELVQPSGSPPLRASWRRGYYGPGE